MAWKKFFTPVEHGNNLSPVSGNTSRAGPARTNYSSYLPDVYTGSPNRVDRYQQYEVMDSDPEVNAALDILAEFCTQKEKDGKSPFNVKWRSKATNSEVRILGEYLQQWNRLQLFDTRIFRIVRNVFKYGDAFFIRDPETQKWSWVDPTKIVKIIVNESDGKKPEQYVIKDLAPNFENLIATQITPNINPRQNGMGVIPSSGYMGAGANQGGSSGASATSTGNRWGLADTEHAINAEHVIHVSLSEGLDNNFPFGNSLLENVFKVYKQKELLEDAILIYRIQRAPERRVFHIDVGNMPSHLAMAFVERVKNEIHQRRIPSQTGGGQNVIDSAYNPLCRDLTTRIPLLDGRTITLQELINEFEAGKENWAYSCDPETGKIVPGVINWAGITRRNTEVIKLTFDNGETLICTPDHKIPVFGKGFVEAQNLTNEDSLISNNTRDKAISGGKTNKYQQIWDHESKTWIWTHRMVGEFFRDRKKHQEFTYLEEHITSPKCTIHHRDSNRYNNDPRNLVYMNKEDHILYHSSQKSDFWKNMSDEYKTEMTDKISNTLKNRWESLTPEERTSALWNIRSAQKKAVWMRQNDPKTAASYKVAARKSRLEYIKNNPEFKKILDKNLESRVKIKNQELEFTFPILQRVVDKVKAGYKNKKEVIALCDHDFELLEMVCKSNSQKLDYKNPQCKIDFTKFGYSKLDRLIAQFGYKNWKSFVKEVDNFNHRVVKIEKVDNRDTGTITIDGTERWHNYHTFAIDSGVFVKNSINEDYFFPMTADGRGSKVDVLPGGTNLGEIDDLKYFTNKLFRGLRIPSSYLPTGADDSQASFNDGRVGTAYIQELRFNKYCERLQNLITAIFDTEFKMFMNTRGVNIDANLFELSFNPPMNFASSRQAAMDTERINTFNTIQGIPYMSKRFAMKRFLGLSADEMAENERLWGEESGKGQPTHTDAAGEMRSAGLSAAGIEGDMGMAGDLSAPDGMEGEMPPDQAGAPGAAPGMPGGMPGSAPQV